jgi:hypothetical protein
VDLNPPSGEEKVDYLINGTAIITDSGNHSISHEFFILYVSRPTSNSTVVSTIPPMTTTVKIVFDLKYLSLKKSIRDKFPVIIIGIRDFKKYVKRLK